MSGSRAGGSQSGIIKAELPFCPFCDHRLRKREYPRLIRRALFLAPEYRWQCEACGYAEPSRSRLPFNLAISGALLALAALSLYVSEDELVDYRAFVQQARAGAQYAGLSLLALGFLAFVVRQFFSEPVYKRLCQRCEAAYVCNQAWTNIDFCSVECVAQAASAAAEDELPPEEIEEVEDDDEDIEDVDDALVEDDPEESALAEAAAEAASEARAEPAAESEVANAPVSEESVADDEQVAEMVLFDEEDAGSGAWNSEDILGEIDEVEAEDLDAVIGDLENSDALTTSETAEAELSLFDTRRFNVMRDMSGEWDVDEILAESDELEENEDLTKSVRLRPGEKRRADIEEAVPAEDSEVRESE